jgi:hypothetical protein
MDANLVVLTAAGEGSRVGDRYGAKPAPAAGHSSFLCSREGVAYLISFFLLPSLLYATIPPRLPTGREFILRRSPGSSNVAVRFVLVPLASTDRSPWTRSFVAPILDDRAGLVATSDNMAYAELNLTMHWLLRSASATPASCSAAPCTSAA